MDGSNWKKNNWVNHGLLVVNILTWFLVNKKLQDLFCDVPKPARFSFSNLKTILFNINPVVQGQIRILKQSKNKESASVSVVDWSQYCCFMYRYRPFVEASPCSMDSSHLSLTYKVLRTVQLFCLWVIFVSFYYITIISIWLWPLFQYIININISNCWKGKWTQKLQGSYKKL